MILCSLREARIRLALFGICDIENTVDTPYGFRESGERSLNLEWPTRYNICMGVARALAYLQEESTLRIMHRDVKPSNILLDAVLIPKLSDFGLGRLYDDKKTHLSTRVAGTL